jgi:hypothetical protein
MIIIDNSNVGYIKRVFSYSKYRILKPLLIYCIFSLISKTFNPFNYNIVLMTVFLFYSTLFLCLILWRPKLFVKRISYYADSKMFEFIIDNFNNETKYNISMNDLNVTINLYDSITRSINYYLEFTNLERKIKQFDYKPWSYASMNNVKESIDKIKSNNS